MNFAKKIFQLFMVMLFSLNVYGQTGSITITKDEIIKKSWIAMFGNLKPEELRSIYVETYYPGNEVPSRITIKRPNLFRNEVKSGVLVFDGKRAAWTERKPDKEGNHRPPEIIKPASWRHFEVDIALVFPAFFDYPSELRGITKTGRKESYEILVQLPLGASVTYFIDTKSLLITRRLVDWDGGSPPDLWEGKITNYTDYKGIQYPEGYNYEGRDGIEKVIYKNFRFNTNAKDELFEIPRDLDAKQPVKSLANSIGMEFILIPAGSFQMGAYKMTSKTDEYPAHGVTISNPFYMSKYPVTVQDFEQFVKESGYKTEGERTTGSWVWSENNKWEQKSDASWRNPYFEQSTRHPVVCVSWNDAQAFCAWLGTKENKNYRLPTEAEFEYTLRAGTTTKYSFMNDTINYSKYGWPQNRTVQGYPTHPVGQKAPNVWGLFDMVGNAWQWCNDWYINNYYASSPDTDPQGPTSGKYKVNRGGMGEELFAWRSAMRDALPPRADYSNQSFRVIISIEE